MVIGVAINTFNYLKLTSGKSALLTSAQQEWLTIQKLMVTSRYNQNISFLGLHVHCQNMTRSRLCVMDLDLVNGVDMTRSVSSITWIYNPDIAECHGHMQDQTQIPFAIQPSEGVDLPPGHVNGV